MKIRKHFFLFTIAVLFLITRLFKITEIPASVYWDEASIGYNAYAITADLKDEWGEFLPLHFRAFGEFKLPVYIYSVVPFVKLMGLNAFSVRLPAVLYSLGSLVLVYLMTKKTTENETASLFAAIFFALSPWGMIITRVGYEVTAGVFFFLLALYVFLVSLKKHKYFLLSTFSHILAIYSYNSFRIISPIFLIVSTSIYLYQKNRATKKVLSIILISYILLLISFFPIYRLYKYDFGGLRYQAVGLQGTLIGKSSQFAKNYLSHFSPEFLFVSGDTNPRSQIPGWGELYWISLPFIIIGVVELFRRKQTVEYLLLLILLISPIPASLTKENPHALRSFLMFPLFAIISGPGINYFLKLKFKYREVLIWASFLMMIFSFEALGQDAFLNYNRKTLSDWQYEYQKIFENYKNNYGDGQKIVVSDQYGQPYIFALFYLKIDPNLFRQTVKYNSPDQWGFSTVASFSNFEFKKIVDDEEVIKI